MKIRLTKNTLFRSESGGWWFRICGYGLGWRDITKHPLLFSERNGYRKGVTIRNWRFSLLTPRGAV